MEKEELNLPPEEEIDKEQTEEFHKFMRIHQEGLYMNRVPPKTKQEFKNFANEEFCGDYGLCLKAIWDYFKADAKYAYLFQRLAVLEQEFYQKDVKTKKNIKLFDGRTIDRGIEE